MRSTGFYFVLREYDRWEEDGELKEKVDNLVQYFLRDEEPKEDDPEAPEKFFRLLKVFNGLNSIEKVSGLLRSLYKGRK